MKTLRGKLVMSAIILSCGLAMHAEPGARHDKATRTGVAATKTRQMVRAAEASAQRSRRTLALREERASW